MTVLKLGCLFLVGYVGGFALGIVIIAFAGRLVARYAGADAG